MVLFFSPLSVFFSSNFGLALIHVCNVMQTQQEEVPEFKLVLVGDNGVGKKSFLKRHQLGHENKTTVESLGLEVFPLRFNTNRGPLQFNVWNSIGQEVSHDKTNGFSSAIVVAAFVTPFVF